jgi:hypothetical protein
MTLTVRLGTTLETALERHCADRGVTKSLVVQESLAAYLVAAAARADKAALLDDDEVSDNYKAFAKAGVRARIAESFARRKERPSSWTPASWWPCWTGSMPTTMPPLAGWSATIRRC